jgi:phage terminase small subunit
MAELTPKQSLFVAEYLIDLNATRAAKSAGYSDKTAYSQGQRLLNNVEVAAVIAEKTKKRMDKLEITADRVLKELAALGFSNMGDYMEVTEDGKGFDFAFGNLTREQMAAIQEITVDTTGGANDGERRLVLRNKFKLGDKRGSLELLGKHLQLFTDKLEISGSLNLADAIAEARKRAGK